MITDSPFFSCRSYYLDFREWVNHAVTAGNAKCVLFLAQLAELFIQADQMLYVSICLCVNQPGTNRNRCTQTRGCNLVRTDLLMNPDRTPKTRLL